MIEAKKDPNQTIHVTRSLSMWILFIDETKKTSRDQHYHRFYTKSTT